MSKGIPAKNGFMAVSPNMGPEDLSNRKKIPIIFLKPNFRKLQNDSKNVSLKIGSKVPQNIGPFFSLFLIRKPISSGPVVSEAIFPTN